jgi:cytochrome c oxidase subunit 3
MSDQTAAVARDADRLLPHEVSGSHSTGWWGMVFFIGTEATFFSLLLASYFFLRFKAGTVWPPSGIAKPTLALPLIMSAVLITSSIPMHIADRAIKKGNTKVMRLGLLVTFLLGSAFLVLQLGVEYVKVYKEFTPQTNVYGSLFFTITGFHGAHVVGGLLMNLWAQLRAGRGHFTKSDHVPIQTIAMYWHFVDIVWVFVFLTLYLSPSI